MSALTFSISEEMERKITDIAAKEGVAVEQIIARSVERMVRDYEGRKLFEEMREQGRHEVDYARELLKR